MSLLPHRIHSLAAAVAALHLVFPATAPAAVPPPASASGAATGTTASVGEREESRVLLVQVGSGVVAAAVTVPASLVVGSWLGAQSGSDLAALPGLLVAAVVPPLAVTLSAWLAGNWGGGTERFRLAPAVWVATGVGVAALVAAGFWGLNANEPGRVALYTAAQSALLPAAAVVTLQWTAAPAGEARLPLVPAVPVVRIAF